MDRTAEFDACLAASTRQSFKRQRLDRSPPSDKYLQEAYRLNDSLTDISNYFERIRRVYISVGQQTAHRKDRKALQDNLRLTDTQRDEIDAQLKSSLEEARRRVAELETIELVRRRAIDNAPLYRKLLRDSKAEQASALLSTHRTGVTWLLNRRLLAIATRHAEARQLRITREAERRRTTHHETREALPGTTSSDVAFDEDINSAIIDDAAVRETLLSPQQLQALEQEQSSMMADLDSQLNQIRLTQQRLAEVGEMSSQLQQHLSEQAELTDRLLSDAHQTTDLVSGGNEQLEKARRSGNRFARWVVILLVTASIVLLLLDLLN
ncbi:hypothetical protein PYCC9005_004978 [Savitreella phatthalungensis]